MLLDKCGSAGRAARLERMGEGEEGMHGGNAGSRFARERIALALLPVPRPGRAWMTWVEAARQMALRPLCTSATIWPPRTWPRSLSMFSALQEEGRRGVAHRWAGHAQRHGGPPACQSVLGPAGAAASLLAARA